MGSSSLGTHCRKTTRTKPETMRLASTLALPFLICGTVAQSQYRPGSGFGGGSSGSFGGGSSGGFGGSGSGYDGAGGAGGFSDAAGGNEGSLEETIPGIPGDDYPIFAEVPETSFFCDGQADGGYYADTEAECQAFHICSSDGNGRLTKYSFLCPNGTMFQQQYFVCDWWFNVDCSLAEQFYSLNEEVAAEREANSGAGGAGGDFSQGPGGQGRGGQNQGRGGQGQGQGGRGGSNSGSRGSSSVSSGSRGSTGGIGGYQGSTSSRGSSSGTSRGSSASSRGGSSAGAR